MTSDPSSDMSTAKMAALCPVRVVRRRQREMSHTLACTEIKIRLRVYRWVSIILNPTKIHLNFFYPCILNFMCICMVHWNSETLKWLHALIVWNLMLVLPHERSKTHCGFFWLMNLNILSPQYMIIIIIMNIFLTHFLLQIINLLSLYHFCQHFCLVSFSLFLSVCLFPSLSLCFTPTVRSCEAETRMFSCRTRAHTGPSCAIKVLQHEPLFMFHT